MRAGLNTVVSTSTLSSLNLSDNTFSAFSNTATFSSVFFTLKRYTRCIPFPLIALIGSLKPLSDIKLRMVFDFSFARVSSASELLTPDIRFGSRSISSQFRAVISLSFVVGVTFSIKWSCCLRE